MNRRNVIATAAATTMVVAATIVAATTVTGPSGDESTTGDFTPSSVTRSTIVRDEYVDDLVYVAVPDATPVTDPPAGVPVGGPGEPDAPSTDVEAGGQPATWTVGGAAVGAAPPSAGGRGQPSSPDVSAPPPAPTVPPTTEAPPTSPPTTWPAGVEVPDDWPAGTPYPPIPAGCRKPHLEDNGIWNCEH